MSEISTTTRTAADLAAPALPFSPLTDQGLSIRINDHASKVNYAVAHNRATADAVVAEARLVYDMCLARTDRIVAAIRRGVAA